MALENGENVDSDQLKVVCWAGRSMVNVKPVFSTDSKYVITCCGCAVKVFSIASGESITELKGHEKPVTGIVLNPQNRYQLLSCSSDRYVIKWDYMDGVALKKYHLGFPAHSFYALPTQNPPTLFTLRPVTPSRYELVSFHLPAKPEMNMKFDVIQKNLSDTANQVSIGPKGAYVACVSRNVLSVYSSKRKSTIMHHLEKDSHFSCVACHPVDLCIATGLKQGKIIIWWNIFKPKKVVKMVQHWHALSVRDLCYTAEGSYLLSGGHECVLLKWQHNSSHKDTLPRLGAPIVGLSCSSDNTLYATCHSDNAIRIISSNFKVVQLYQGLTRGHRDLHIEDPIPTGLLLDPRTKSLVLNGKPGHLQFYSVYNDKQLYNLDIVRQNYISPENLARPLVLTEVENAAFDSSGSWMATLEHRNDQVTTPEMRLKFWAYSQEKQEYILNTTVHSPHTQKIHTLKFRPPVLNCPATAVTTSEDGKFKLWQLLDDTDIHRTNDRWDCELVGFYRELPAGSADFSQDGSLLAVGFDRALTLWDPDVNALRTTLSYPKDDSKIKQVLFGHHSNSHLLHCITYNRLIVWDLLSCAVMWSKQLDVSVMVQNPLCDVIAVFTKKMELYVFNSRKSEPIFHKKGVSDSDIASALFVPRPKEGDHTKDALSWQNSAQLYFINKNQDMMTFSAKDEKNESDNNAGNTLMKLSQKLPETPFSSLMSERRKTGLKDEDLTWGGSLGQPGTHFLEEMLSTPAHVLPPVHTLCMSFIESLILKRKTDGNKTLEEDEDNDDEEEMEVESHTANDTETDSDTEVITKPSTVSEKESESTVVGCQPDSETIINTVDVQQRTRELNQIDQNQFSWIANRL